MPKHDLYIYEIGGQYRVRPATVSVEVKSSNSAANEGGSKQDGKLKIRNVTKKQMVLIFPDALVGSQNTVALLAPSQKEKVITILADAPVEAYPYSVFTVENGKPVFACGESDPIIIVDD